MNAPENCQTRHCGCGNLSRRDFVSAVGLGVAAAMAGSGRVMAGPFDVADFQKLVPADKKLHPDWVKSLFERGEPAWYRGEQLKFIGMPIGGLCAGQVYLGGDGRLWHWDIFNQHIGTGPAHYAAPLAPSSPLAQGFALRITAGGKSTVRTLDRAGFADVRFRGEYPIGLVEYRDADSPVEVRLEAFSPFIPLDTANSSLPAIVMHLALKNSSAQAVDAELAGWLENAVCLETAKTQAGQRRSRVRRDSAMVVLDYSAAPNDPSQEAAQARPDILFEDFEKAAYDGWSIAGSAFGPGPIQKAKMPSYQGDVGGQGKGVVNSHNVRGGGDVGAGDAHTGRLTSPEFTIQRRFITFYIGGGQHAGKTCLNLLVDGKPVRTATGHNNNAMRRASFDVSALEGQTARIEIIDDQKGAWGNIGVDHIVFSDSPGASGPLDKQGDFGTMAFALLSPQPADEALPALPGGAPAQDLFARPAGQPEQVSRPFSQKLIGALQRKLHLEPGQSADITFLITWHFPNLKLKNSARDVGRYYTPGFSDAAAFAHHVAANFARLHAQTRLWRDTWYDSTLPYWFLDRTFANTSILATSTCHRFASGRFYGWEGVGCCEGTCTHVWHYAHAVARLFPELERDLRERTDLGLAFQPQTGIVKFRGEVAGLAVDGQAGCILRAYREHQMSADDAFLRRIWPNLKRAMQCLIDKDADADGIVQGAQHNTLDADWHGPVAWLSGLYLAALRAAEEMAREVGDDAFAQRCRAIFDVGHQRIAQQLFDGEYFINKPDPKRLDAINSGTGCEIDQVFGQSWAFQVALGRVLPEKETHSALRSLWKYNFTPDVGPYRAANKPGRWYAMPGEAGLLMCTFPRSDWDYRKAAGKGPDWAAGYFNECMNGFEYQVAGHMIWEGMVQEGLAITRAVHDRYSADRRNPWNEVECGDHYARSMASYGVFLAACGFEYHGPRGHLAFAPRLSPDNFRAPFTTAKGWGTFSQKTDGPRRQVTLAVKWGELALRTLGLQWGGSTAPKTLRIRVNGQPQIAQQALANGRLLITLPNPLRLVPGQNLELSIE